MHCSVSEAGRCLTWMIQGLLKEEAGCPVVTRSVSEGERSRTLAIQGLVKHSPSLTLRVWNHRGLTRDRDWTFYQPLGLTTHIFMGILLSHRVDQPSVQDRVRLHAAQLTVRHKENVAT